MASPSSVNRRLIATLLVFLLLAAQPPSLTAFVSTRPNDYRTSSPPSQAFTFTRRYLYIDPETHVVAGGEAAPPVPPPPQVVSVTVPLPPKPTTTAATTPTVDPETHVVAGEAAVPPPQVSVTVPLPPKPTTTTATTPTPAVSVSSSRRRRKTEPKKDYLHPVTSSHEFDTIVHGETDRLVVVRFHAPYCKACQSIAVAYDRLAKTNPTVKFVDVTIKDRLDYPDLDVPATPYAHIYDPDVGLVESSPIARRQFSKFKKVLRWYRKGQCELPDEFFTNPHYEFDSENLIL